MQRQTTAVGISVLIGSDAAALVACRPSARLLAELAHPRAWVAASGADAATAELAAGLLWLLACWLGIGLLACGLGRLPGGAGALAQRTARLVLPRAIYRLAAGATGLGITLAPAAAGAVPADAPAPPPPVAAPQWPAGDGGAPHAPGWPTSNRAPAHAAGRTPAHNRDKPQQHRGHRPPPTPSHVVVHEGETLWQIAAAHLSGRPSAARVAAAWPRWYAANRRVIGDDPNLIQPGQTLRPPSEGPRS
jgi:nucleoid-associated protein YgaU